MCSDQAQAADFKASKLRPARCLGGSKPLPEGPQVTLRGKGSLHFANTKLFC